jgi:hypothetical protein
MKENVEQKANLKTEKARMAAGFFSNHVGFYFGPSDKT